MASCRAALAIVLVMHASLAFADVRTADARACSLVRARSSASAEAAVCGRSAVLHEASALRLRGGATATSGWMQWAYKTLAKFGIFLKKGRLLVLGLDNAGKSTLLTVLLRDEVVPTAPTHQPVTDVIKIGHMKLRAVDMGGHEIARRMWAQYSHEADGIVYIVDAVDRDRFAEAALELHKLLAAPSLAPTTPVLILANKVDLPHAAGQEELYYALGLDELTQAGSARPVGLYLCSIFERRGYMEGFDWLATHI